MSGLEIGILVVVWLIVLIPVRMTRVSVITIAIIGLFHIPLLIALCVRGVIDIIYGNNNIIS